jgi:predicted PurR-regulated permease PerM
VVGAALALQRIQSIITPLILAAILAFILNPVVGFFNRYARIPRSLVLVSIYVVFMALLSAAVAALVPPLAEQIRNLMVQLPAMLRDLEQLLDREIALGPFAVDLSGLLAEAEQALLDFVQSIGRESVNFLGGVVAVLAEAGVTIVFMFIVSLYLVKDGHQAIDWLYDSAPPSLREDLRRLVREVNQIWRGFFGGQIVLTTVVAIIVGSVSAIIGLPWALLMGVLAGLLEMLPSLGHGIWLVTAVLLALFSGSTWEWMPLSNFWFAVLVVGLHLVFQQIDLNYLIPRIIGRRVHLHPLIVILGILIGASLGGVLGILLAAPTIGSLRVLGRYVYANLLDVDPFPAATEGAEEDESPGEAGLQPAEVS